MKPIQFNEQNKLIAEDQEEYLTLPANISQSGEVTCCWELNFKERLKLLLTGKLWLTLLTFNFPLQPHLPSVDKPKLGGK